MEVKPHVTVNCSLLEASDSLVNLYKRLEDGPGTLKHDVISIYPLFALSVINKIVGNFDVVCKVVQYPDIEIVTVYLESGKYRSQLDVEICGITMTTEIWNKVIGTDTIKNLKLGSMFVIEPDEIAFLEDFKNLERFSLDLGSILNISNAETVQRILLNGRLKRCDVFFQRIMPGAFGIIATGIIQSKTLDDMILLDTMPPDYIETITNAIVTRGIPMKFGLFGDINIYRKYLIKLLKADVLSGILPTEEGEPSNQNNCKDKELITAAMNTKNLKTFHGILNEFIKPTSTCGITQLRLEKFDGKLFDILSSFPNLNNLIIRKYDCPKDEDIFQNLIKEQSIKEMWIFKIVCKNPEKILKSLKDAVDRGWRVRSLQIFGSNAISQDVKIPECMVNNGYWYQCINFREAYHPIAIRNDKMYGSALNSALTLLSIFGRKKHEIKQPYNIDAGIVRKISKMLLMTCGEIETWGKIIDQKETN